MKCMVCGTPLDDPERVDLAYRGLPGVILVDIEAYRCAACGEVEYEIPRIEALNHTIASALVSKADRLSGIEVRFLRKLLAWQGKELAARIGVTPETVSRWENGTLVIGETPDRLLRMFVLHETCIEPFQLERLGELAKQPGEPLSLRLAASKGWRALAARVEGRPPPATRVVNTTRRL